MNQQLEPPRPVAERRRSRNTTEKPDASARQLAILLRELLDRQAFECASEVKAALWHRCRQLRIATDVASLDRALDLVGTNRPLVCRPSPAPSRAVVSEPAAPGFTKAEARALVARLGIPIRGL